MKKHSDKAQDAATVKVAVHKHEKSMHPGKPLTKLAKGGGIKVRGTGAAIRGTRARGPMA